MTLDNIKGKIGEVGGKVSQFAGDAAGKASQLAGDAGGRISEYTQSDDFKKLIPYLLAGGAGAAAGGILTSKRRARQGESRISHLGRVLTNALMAGGLTAGSAALINKGVHSAAGSVDKAKGVNGGIENEGPLAAVERGVAFSPITATAAGAAGLAATHGSETFGAGNKTKADDLANLLSKIKGRGVDNASDLRGTSPVKIQEIIDKVDPTGADGLNKLRQRAGVAAGKTEEMGMLSKLTRQGPMSTFGQTTPRRIGRGALGLTAAAIPALAGAFFTKDPEA